ncbi:MAG: hypothetical protein ACO3A4_12760 [Silvanigrellaceae bacterium]
MFEVRTRASLVLICFIFAACKPKPSQDLSVASADQIESEASTNIENAFEGVLNEESSLQNSFGLSQNNSGHVKNNFLSGIIRGARQRWLEINKKPCALLKPLMRVQQNSLLRPYFFVGTSAEAGMGIHGVAGIDYVWDFYNFQVASFKYRSLEAVLGSGSVGAGLNSYLGLAFGVRDDVHAAWSGKFASTGISGSLPVLADYLSIHANFFTAINARSKPDPSLAGASIGLSAALGLPTSSPGALQIASGDWVVDKGVNALIAKRLSSHKISHATVGDGTCNGNCIRIDYGNMVKGYLGRSVNLVRTIPAVFGGPANLSLPTSLEKIVLLAFAIGAFRDSKNAQQLCR